MSTVSIREATSADIPLINELAVRIWKAHYPDIISMEQIDYMLEKMYSHQSLQQQMNEGYVFHLVLIDDKTVGYISIGEKNPGEFFLSKFYIDPSEQGRGIGRQVFDMAVQQLSSPKIMRLQVNRQNYKSVNFYFRMGFVIEYAKDFEIGDGYVMDDFVMIRRF